jgi:arylsulfatase A-like enzyme
LQNRDTWVQIPSAPQNPTPTVAALRGLTLGATAGALSAIADIASTILWLAPGRDQARLVAVLLPLGAALGALVGASALLADALLSRALSRPLLRHAALSALPLSLVAWLLFTGGRMRRLPAPWLLRPLAALALVAAAALGLTLLRNLTSALRARSLGARSLGAGLFIAAAMVLHAVDHRVLPRLYEYLHASLGALTLLAFACAASLFARPRPSRPAVALSALALALAPWAFTRLDAWPNVRAEVFGVHAPFVRHLALGLTALRPAPTARPYSPRAVDPSAGVDRSALPRWEGAHVLLVTIDAMRADRLGRVVEGRSLTPTLDALAAHGTVFRRTYAQAPHSSYSLSSLHTGEYLHETVPLGQRQPLPTLAETFGRAGYATAAVFTRGVFFTEGERLTAYRDRDLGFTRADHVDRDARGQADALVRELDDIVRRGEPPSLAWVHFFDAHAPYQGAGPTPEDQYNDGIRHIDAALATVLDHARSVLHRPLIVAVTADHGEEFGEHGGVYHGSTLYEEQVRVPLLIAAPGMLPRIVEEPAQLIDVAPTLLGLAGLSPAPTMRGTDLRPWMLPSQPFAPRTVFAAVNTRVMVVRRPFKLIADLTFGVEELYDLSRDPSERRNLAEARGAERASLRAALDAWLASLAAESGGGAALARGRLGDRTAARDLVALARDRSRPAATRAEAVTLIARFADASLVSSLAPLLRDPSPDVRAEAAIALGRAGDRRARPALLDLLASDPPERRWRAALSLDGDPRATEALVEALWSDDEALALDAVRALGSIRDGAAFEALVARLPDDHVRYRAVFALGASGDPRALDLLHQIWRTDPTDDVRSNAVAALGMLGDRRAVPWLLGSIGLDRSERYAPEALGALGAVGREVAGWDARNATVDGVHWVRCEAHEDTLGWRLLRAHGCVSASAQPELTVTNDWSGEAMVVVRARRDGPGDAVGAALRIDGREVARWTLSPGWDEVRLAVGRVSAGAHPVVILLDNPSARARVDHLLLLPRR